MKDVLLNFKNLKEGFDMLSKKFFQMMVPVFLWGCDSGMNSLEPEGSIDFQYISQTWENAGIGETGKEKSKDGSWPWYSTFRFRIEDASGGEGKINILDEMRFFRADSSSDTCLGGPSGSIGVQDQKDSLVFRNGLQHNPQYLKILKLTKEELVFGDVGFRIRYRKSDKVLVDTTGGKYEIISN